MRMGMDLSFLPGNVAPSAPTDPYTVQLRKRGADAKVQEVQAASLDLSLSYQIFKKKSKLVSSDSLVYCDGDQDTLRYYVSVPFRWSGKWDITVFRECDKGDVAGTIKKKNLSDNMDIEAPDLNFRTRFTREDGSFTRPDLYYQFTGVDGRSKYRWQWKSGPKYNFLCQDEKAKTVAMYNSKTWHAREVGDLTVSPDHGDEAEIILLTVIALEEWLAQTGFTQPEVKEK
ncbi:hypothetical protein T439DRAFT_330442 [Meredithblackwellia eburnea MCA 4105]